MCAFLEIWKLDVREEFDATYQWLMILFCILINAYITILCVVTEEITAEIFTATEK